MLFCKYRIKVMSSSPIGARRMRTDLQTETVITHKNVANRIPSTSPCREKKSETTAATNRYINI